MARKSLAKRYRRQVRAEAGLRFDPEVQTVREARREARSQARGDIRVARQGARGIQRSADRALPVARKRLGEALATVGVTPSPDVASSVLGAAAGRDSAGAKRRLAETLAGTETELLMRKNDAAAGATSAVRQARSVLADTNKKLGDRLTSIARQRGQFSQARSGELVEDARDRATTRRGQDVTERGSKRSAAQSERGSKRSAGIDPDTGKPIPGSRLDPDGNGKPGDQSKKGKGKGAEATPQQVIDASSAIDLAKRQAKRAKGDGRSRSEAAGFLVQGRAALTDPATGKKVPNTEYQKVKQLWASVGLDLAYDGKLSAANRAKLHRLGYSLADLGIKTPTAAKRPPRHGGPPSSGAGGYPSGKGAGQVH